MNNKGLLKAIFFTALIAAALDLGGAVVSFMISRDGAFPKKILEYIAGGVYGGSALDGSLSMNITGAFLHFFIATIWTVLFFIFYPKIKWLHKSIWINAVVYGLIVWIIMNLVILPLSAWKAPITPFNLKEASKGAFILMVCIGLPIAIGAKKYYKEYIITNTIEQTKISGQALKEQLKQARWGILVFCVFHLFFEIVINNRSQVAAAAVVGNYFISMWITESILSRGRSNPKPFILGLLVSLIVFAIRVLLGILSGRLAIGQ